MEFYCTSLNICLIFSRPINPRKRQRVSYLVMSQNQLNTEVVIDNIFKIEYNPSIKQALGYPKSR